jgi:predicted phosphodiesterase
MQVLIVGDVHGRHDRLADLLERARRALGIDAAIQVGDFGFAASALGAVRTPFPIPVYAIDGNHEDHRWLQRAIDEGEAQRWAAQLNLFYQPRGSTAVLGGSTVGFLGGALHVDQPQQHNGPAGLANYIRRREVDAAAADFNRARPHLVVTHSCPAGIGIGLTGPQELQLGVLDYVVAAGFDPGPVHDCGDAELTALWSRLAYRPPAWVFGHHHRLHATTVEGTHFVCVGEGDAAVEQPVIWDSTDRTLWTAAR